MPKTRKWFARQGTTFSHAYATTPLCCPSRATIFTGLYTHNHNVRVDMNHDATKLDQSLTVQRHLRKAGYRTGMLGKYLNGWPLAADPPHFDEWAIFDNSYPSGYYGGIWNVNGKKKRVTTYSTRYLADSAARFIRSGSGGKRPWMLVVSTAAPHRPYTAEPRYRRATVPKWAPPWEQDVSDKPAFVLARAVGKKHAAKVRAQQLRTLMSVDDAVDRILRTLDQTGERSNTLAVFVSDNGYLWGQHQTTGKMLPYLDSVQIPLMMTWPEQVEEGVVDDRLASTADLAPTMLDAAGIPRALDPDGRSLLNDWDRPRLLLEFFEAFARPSWAATVTKRSQYVEYYRGDGGRPFFREYYDLRDDPHQATNLLVDGDPRNDPNVALLARRLARDRTCKGSDCP